MEREEPLLGVAAAVADGTGVDWETAALAVSTDDDRRLLSELRFIADLASGTSGDAAGSAAASASGHGRPSERHVSPGESWGPLRIIEPVGQGTFGDVYRAWDSRLDREVALKILRRGEPANPARSSTVIQEGRLLARVRHPNVVTVYGAERVNGQVGVWMEFVRGRTLEDELRAGGTFDVARAIRIGIDLAGALSAIHRAGLLHRDVKAQNVLCDPDGRLVLTDFGAGCDLQEDAAGAGAGLAGTPLSVAPEVLDGQPASPSADLYSLGVLLYHLVSGAYPVRGRTLKEIRQAHAGGVRTPLSAERPGLPAAFVRIVDRAIDPSPGNRHETADAIGSELAALEAATQAGRTPAMTAPGWRKLMIAAAFIAAAGAGAAMFLTSRSTAGAAESQPINPEIELVEVLSLTESGRLEDAYERARRARAVAPASPAAASAAAYVLTYAGFVDEAARAIADLVAADPDYLEENGWWTPTALLYQRRFDEFLERLRGADTRPGRLYRALAELERGDRPRAGQHLVDADARSEDVFDALATALQAGISGRGDEAVRLVRELAARRRTEDDRDGEVTFKQAQIVSVAGDAAAALAMLDEAVAEGFVCVICFERSVLLDAVRAQPGYAAVRDRAVARHNAFGKRFGFSQTPVP